MCLNCELLERRIVGLEARLTEEKLRNDHFFTAEEQALFAPMEPDIGRILSSPDQRGALRAFLLARFGGEKEIMAELESLRAKVKAPEAEAAP